MSKFGGCILNVFSVLYYVIMSEVNLGTDNVLGGVRNVSGIGNHKP